MPSAKQGGDIVHDPAAAAIVEEAIRAEVVMAGIPRIRVLAATDEQVALRVIHALDRHGLEIVRRAADDA